MELAFGQKDHNIDLVQISRPETTLKREKAVVVLNEGKESAELRLDLVPDEAVAAAREVRSLMFSVLANLIYRRKDNASCISQDKRVWKLILGDARRAEGSAELRAASVGLLVSVLEHIDKFDVIENRRCWVGN